MQLPIELFKDFIFSFSLPQQLGKFSSLNKEFHRLICDLDKGIDLPHVSWVDGNKRYRMFEPVFSTRLKVVDLYQKLVSKTLVWGFRTLELDTEDHLHQGIMDIFKLVYPLDDCPSHIEFIIGWCKYKEKKIAFLATRKYQNLFTFQHLKDQSPIFQFETDWLSTEKPITRETIWKSFGEEELIMEGFYLI